MKSDDEKETRFDNNLKNQENTEEKPKHNPFGLGNDFNYQRPSESAHEPFTDPADFPPFGFKENTHNRSKNGDRFADKSPQNNSSRTYEEKTKDLPPMTKRLGEGKYAIFNKYRFKDLRIGIKMTQSVARSTVKPCVEYELR